MQHPGVKIKNLRKPPKHHLADPAFAVRLLGLDENALLAGPVNPLNIPRDGSLLGHLFESLVTLSLKVYAQFAEAEVRQRRFGVPTGSVWCLQRCLAQRLLPPPHESPGATVSCLPSFLKS